MEKADYKKIIESGYSRESWQKLLYDIFHNRVDFRSNPIREDSSSEIVKDAFFLGKIDLSDNRRLGIYEVELGTYVDIERSRVQIRNLLISNWHNQGFDGAFIFCFKQNQSVLRFSYVSEFGEITENGEWIEHKTDTKRYTYYLGEGHRCRTAIDEFWGLRDTQLKLEDITKALSIEAVSKRFFDRYREIYATIIEFITGKRLEKVGNKWVERIVRKPNIQLMQEFASYDDPEKTIRDYVKKLLGRLVFLQFLQKKGWLGVPVNSKWGSGDKEYMHNLWGNCQVKENFIDGVLEVLFDDLNTDRKDSNFEVSNPILGKNIKVPYLNGGLFEKDRQDQTTFKLPASYIDMILNFFEEYNFTIDENDPYDAEIGIDPEMLGKVFENLLEDNKDKGVFYTPKEIVKYMCTEALLTYLQSNTNIEKSRLKKLTDFSAKIDCFTETEKKLILQYLRTIKVCDPAIGSGAFPMGMLNLLYFCRRSLGDCDNFSEYEIKEQIIQNNIYGVDIDKGAVDIARLRFWLALMVDSAKPTPLPNLDYKIMQGNSLLECYNGVDLRNLSESEDLYVRSAVDGLPEKEKAFFDSHNLCTKNKLRREINDTIKNCIKAASNLTVDFDIPNDKFFLWHTWFKNVFDYNNGALDSSGFDIIIGNPPYVKEYTNKHAFDGFRETSKYYQGKMDLWYGFACSCIDMLADHGILSFIATNNWTTNSGAQYLRNKIINDTLIKQILDFNSYMVFGDSASIQTMIFILQKDNNNDNYSLKYSKLNKAKPTRIDMVEILMNCECEKWQYYPSIIKNISIDNTLSFDDSQIKSLLDKINQDSFYLKSSEVANGIHTHFDVVDNKLHKKYPYTILGEGIFVLSKKEITQLNLTENELLLLKPFYTSKQAHKYFCDSKNDEWIIYTDSHFKNPTSMDHYQNLKKHLDRFQEIITSDNKPYGLHRSRKEYFFKGEKVAALRKCVGSPIFTYIPFDSYLPASFYIIKTDKFDLKYITGLFNSALIRFWLKHKGKMQGTNYQVDKEPLLRIPIKRSPIIEENIAENIERITSSTTKFDLTTIGAIEKQIDKDVYRLYNITLEEQTLIEEDISSH